MSRFQSHESLDSRVCRKGTKNTLHDVTGVIPQPAPVLENKLPERSKTLDSVDGLYMVQNELPRHLRTLGSQVR